MAVSESQRHELHAKLEAVIGKEHAETIMSLLPPVGWADVATKHDLVELEGRLVTRLESLDNKIEAVEAKLGGKIEAVEAKVGGKIEAVEAKLGGKIEAVEAKLGGKIEAVEAKVEAGRSEAGKLAMKTALMVNIPTILASFALAFTAVRLG